jgi:lysine 2,3-aminomutase
MVLNNSKIAAWLGALAEAGVESIRVGTKEMAFYPQRFDDAFLAMLDRFHETYPDVGSAPHAALRAPGRDPGQG